jgi:hypothetical protein
LKLSCGGQQREAGSQQALVEMAAALFSRKISWPGNWLPMKLLSSSWLAKKVRVNSRAFQRQITTINHSMDGWMDGWMDISAMLISIHPSIHP